MQSAHAQLWSFEQRTLPVTELAAGPLDWRHLRGLTLILLITIFLVLWPTSTLIATALMFPLARLLALDLTLMVLPDVYTLPLLVAGILIMPMYGPLFAPFFGAMWAGGLLLFLAWLSHVLSKGKSGIGGGDVKLAAALGAWAGWPLAVWLPAVAAFLMLPFALIPYRQNLPLGPALICAFLLLMFIGAVF